MTVATPFQTCPTCGDRDFLVEEHRGSVAFRCLGCTASWRYELGYVWQIDWPEAEAAPPVSEPVSRRDAPQQLP